MKKISQRNLYYSLVLAAVMMLFLIGYFAWMLPSLYVDYIEEQNVEAVKEQHNAFMEHGSYDGIQVKNPSACASVKIPFSGPDIEVATKLVSMKITAVEHETQALLTELQKFIKSLQSEGLGSTKADSKEADSGAGKRELRFVDSRFYKQINKWKNKLSDISAEYVKLPVKIEFIQPDHKSQLYNSELFKVHSLSDRKAVLEASVENYENKYTNYLVIEYTVDGIVCSILPVVTPEMEEIRPVVMQSLPMLGAVILVITLIFSQVYSGGIVQPVYQKLEDMNQVLLEENKRQEVFMRASSHQLKTPITAALLLLDGMINQIGKYKETQIYLPKVKEQLLSMRRMVEEILSLHQNHENLNLCEIGLYELVQSLLAVYSVAACDKQLQIILEGDQKAYVRADRDVLSKILDNILSNAVNYTPEGAQIRILVQAQKIAVWNQGADIPQEILEHIFEPFVRGSHEGRSHGLGLYIAAYYAKLSDIELSVANREGGVESVIQFRF